MTELLLSVGIDIGTSRPKICEACFGVPRFYHILGKSEFCLRKISAVLRFYGLTPAPRCGAPVVEVPI